ncbi:MAG: hypothetical protein VB144_08105 [Clostridia bacterium]|nr:hypothetical protein [Clostridia bacterium]
MLIVEACTHHPIDDDMGTVKVPIGKSAASWLSSGAAELIALLT